MGGLHGQEHPKSKPRIIVALTHFPLTPHCPNSGAYKADKRNNKQARRYIFYDMIPLVITVDL